MKATRVRAIAESYSARKAKPLALQVVSTLGTRIIVLAFTFAVNVIAARALGPEERGQLALMILVPGIVSTFSLLGLDASNLYFAGSSSEVFYWITKLSFVHALLCGSITASGIYLLGTIWPSARLGLSSHEMLYALALTPIIMIGALLGNAEAGRGRITIYNLVSASAMAVYLFGVILAGTLNELTVNRIFLIFFLSHIIASLMLVASCRIWHRMPHPPLDTRHYITYGLRAYLSNITQYLMLRLNTPMLQVMAGTAAVGLYAVAYPITESLLLLAMAINLSLLPRIARSELTRSHLTLIASATLVLCLIGSLILALSAPIFIPIVFGPDYSEAAQLLWILLPGFSLFIFGRVFQTFFAGHGVFLPSILSACCAIIVLILGGYCLISRYGAVGASLALSLGCMAFAISICWWFVHFGTAPKKELSER